MPKNCIANAPGRYMSRRTRPTAGPHSVTYVALCQSEQPLTVTFRERPCLPHRMTRGRRGLGCREQFLLNRWRSSWTGVGWILRPAAYTALTNAILRAVERSGRHVPGLTDGVAGALPNGKERW